MNIHERRVRLRAMLAGSECHSPASVFDPFVARIAEDVGYALGLLSGSVVSATVVAAPDLLLQTATEFAEQIRRIARATTISLLTDADNGYGNALNVMRTVREFEAAGVSGMSVEDVAAPLRFGQSPDTVHLTPIDEMTGKLRAAVAARSDASLVIAARTGALKHAGREEFLERVRAYTACGVDAIWTVTIASVDDLKALRATTHLPIIVGTDHGNVTRANLAAHNVRIMLQGHLPLAAVAAAVRRVYAHLLSGGEPDELRPFLASTREMDRILADEHYRNDLNDYLR